MIKARRCFGLLLVLLLLYTPGSLAEERTGTLEIIGVPPEIPTGNYDSSAKRFTADVREIPDAIIRVTYDDMRLSGLQLEWLTEEEHLTFSHSVSVWREDLDLEADWLEYDGQAKVLTAKGNVKATTEDAVIYAEHLVYTEDTDEALFTEGVRVEFSDGAFTGEKFLFKVEEKTLQFFGPFQGSFQSSQ